jgi:type I restriction-modification system DNA methylase subunit
LKKVSGDAFGRIYEYFLIPFADQKVYDGGELFTRISLVSLIGRVLEPDAARYRTRPAVPRMPVSARCLSPLCRLEPCRGEPCKPRGR